MDGATSQTWTQWYVAIRDDLGILLSVAGIVLSLIGFGIAFWQISRTRKAADAATAAAGRTRKAISKMHLWSDAATCTRNIQEIKYHIERDNFGAAEIRTKDLISDLIQIKERAETHQENIEIESENILSQLSIVRDEIDKKVLRATARVDKFAIFQVLGLVADSLAKLSVGVRSQSKKVT